MRNTTKMVLDKERDSLMISLRDNAFVELTADMDREALQIRRYHGKREFHWRLLYCQEDSLARWISPDRELSASTIRKAKAILIKWMETDLPAMVLDGRQTPAYKMLAERCAEYDMPEHYKTDLTYWDALTCFKNPSCFVFSLRNTGTWLFTHNNEWTRQTMQYEVREEPRAHFFAYADGKLREVTRDTIMSYILLLGMEEGNGGLRWYH